MSARKFYRWNSGGNCIILRRDLPSGAYFLISDSDGCALPRKGRQALIGFYPTIDADASRDRTIIWPGVPRPMPVDVRTARYIITHGHAPRGKGAWAFLTGKGEQWIKGIHTYGEAKRIAVAEARRMGDLVIEVLP